MSVRDEFFQKAEENAKAKAESDAALKRDIALFQEETAALLVKIKDWFAGTSFSTELSNVSVMEGGNRYVAPSLTIRNGSKTLTIVPEGTSFIGIHGVLKATISDPEKAPRTTSFELHWKDAIRNIPGWGITQGVLHMEFNQENFFKHLSSFA